MGSGSDRILCIEDEPNTCELFQIILPQFEIVSAFTIAQGVELASKRDFSLIFVDYYLPDGYGDEACRKIRELDQETPILFVTASTRISERIAHSLGAQGILKKQSPTFIDDLRSRATELATARG
jgi:two-component system OmpR family response regulator